MFGKDDLRKKDGDVIGFIGKGVRIEGKVSFENDDTVRIDGSFKGEIDARGTLVVGEGGNVEGEIKVNSAIVTGEIRGLLSASSRVELKSPGRMLGDITTPTLIIGEGALFEGNCTMVRKDPAPAGAFNYGVEEKSDSV
jgi:cytoskeletal protein CcmA (bactofilin family)